jgi:hypothetical protein
MDRALAEKLLSATTSLDLPLGEIDAAISALTDPVEKRAWALKLGEVFQLLNDEFIRPLVREFPDLDPDR